MTLREELASGDDLARALALVRWMLGADLSGRALVPVDGGPPTIGAEFFNAAPATLQQDLRGARFQVEGEPPRPDPARHVYDVREDGSVWLTFPDGRSEQRESSTAVHSQPPLGQRGGRTPQSLL